MSKQTILNNTGQQLQVNTDRSRIFLWENRYHDGNWLNNSQYDPLTLPAGTLMGRIKTTGVLVPLTSWATDGSQYPVGILADDITLDAGDTQQVSLCIYGDVAEAKVGLYGSGDSLDTVVDNRQLRDHIAAQGIRLIPTTDMTDFDNS